MQMKKPYFMHDRNLLVNSDGIPEIVVGVASVGKGPYERQAFRLQDTMHWIRDVEVKPSEVKYTLDDSCIVHIQCKKKGDCTVSYGVGPNVVTKHLDPLIMNRWKRIDFCSAEIDKIHEVLQ